MMEQNNIGGTVMKWSSKPPDYKAARVRDNQRRHRQRVKSHIAILETRLAETQSQLQQALARVDILTRELANARPAAPAGSVPGRLQSEFIDQGATRILSSQKLPFYTSRDFAQSQRRNSETSITQLDDITNPTTISHQSIVVSSLVGETSCFGAGETSEVHPFKSSCALVSEDKTGASVVVPDDDDDDEAEYCNLQPPRPHESTTRCRDAYKMITEQNFAGLEHSVLREWLQPGFRGALREGDGCRVDNKLLFALLDYISSSLDPSQLLR
ncbi:hypothetical protein BX600DRAFT_152853 [Xylariales sp. PMI_506]|nr:hypothetical protein BX600DRAFT_152853 [Xylariales sp. PMI_506]